MRVYFSGGGGETYYRIECPHPKPVLEASENGIRLPLRKMTGREPGGKEKRIIGGGGAGARNRYH